METDVISSQHIIERLQGVKPLVAHPDWLCWKDLVEDMMELHATSPQHYQALFNNQLISQEDVDGVCGLLAQLMQTSGYTLALGQDGLPCLELLQTNHQIPARPVDVLYAVHHRLAVVLAQ